jgi:flagellar motility protein MotE (MotC chaperone)
MKSKKVAGILANMSPEKAAKISAYLYRKPPSD